MIRGLFDMYTYALHCLLSLTSHGVSFMNDKDMKLLYEAWTVDVDREMLDKEEDPTSVRNSRAVPKTRTVPLETGDNARATG